jgi:replicative DNA helicase
MANLLDENGVKDAPIDTGFSDLDDILWGIQPSDFFILAARPSIGKTAFSMQVAANIAKKNKRVLFLSLEMNEEQLTRRMLSQESGVSYQRILKSQHLSKDNKAALLEAAARIRTLPLDIDYSSGQQLGSIRNRAHQINSIHTENKIAIIMIDYISLLCTHGENFEELTRISSGLKAMAKDLDIVIWGVSQLSRSGEYRDSRRPQLSDLRMCGEQDADQVLMLWNPNRKKDVVEALLEKHRNGRCGSATFAFDNDTVRFSKGSW